MYKFLILMFLSSTSFAANIQMIGDSIFATSNHRTSSEASRLSGKAITDHSQTGAWMNQVIAQYKGIRGNIDIVIMDGGGNNVLGNSNKCRYTVCTDIVDNAINELSNVMTLMAEDSVKTLIFVGVHYPRKGNSGYEKSVDYAYTKLVPLCDNSPVPCILLDGRTILNNDNLLEWDGVHPNWNGTAKLGEAISKEL
jgi:lysophospholipase L1-like esterase